MTIFNKLFSPPVFDDEIKTQQAFMLHIILWILVCVPIPFLIYAIAFSPDIPSRTLRQAGFGEIVNVILLIMLHRGFVRTASIIQVSAFWFFFTVTAYTGSGVQSEAYLLGYGLVIVIAGILLGGTGASVFTILSIAAGGWMVNHQMQGASNLSFDTSPLTTWIVSVILFPVGAVLQHLSSRNLRTALTRARASEERYRLISLVSSDYTFVTEVHKDGGTSLSWVAGAFEKMTGYTYEEYVSSGSWLAHVHPDDLIKDAQDMEKLHKNQDIKSEIRTITKNGEVRWESIFAHPVWSDKENRLIGIVGAVQDVTERKQAAEALRESEAIYRQAIEIAGGVPYHQTFDEHGEIHYDFMSEGIRQITGYGPEEFTDTLWGSLVQERHLLEDLAEFSLDDAIQRVRSGKNPIWKCEHCIKARDGKIHWVFEAAVDIRDEHGIAYGSVGLYQDITERKKFIEELESKNAELERFTYSVSHDLKSPLVTIRGFLGFLERHAQEGNYEKLKQDMKRIESAVEKMHNLLKDLLELSRIGRLTNPPVKIPFNELVRDSLEIVDGQIKAGNVHVEYIKNDVTIKCDRIRMLEVMQNLIDNAIKFMGEQSDPQIEIGYFLNDKNEKVFYVKDNGVGIAPEYHEKIFGLFDKLRADSEGTGIGLALVKRIIEVHGGRIWVESQIGKGAAFYFILP
jgi:PAS domain S-box-containing protein